MTIGQLMTSEVQPCTPDDTLQRAAQIMWDHDCGSVPVVDGYCRVIGIVTDRDICMGALFGGQRLHECTVGEVMSEPALTCSPQDSIEDAQAMMRSHQIRRLPVVDDDHRLVGILSLNDLAVAAPDAENRKRGVQPVAVADTLSAISEHRHHDGGPVANVPQGL